MRARLRPPPFRWPPSLFFPPVLLSDVLRPFSRSEFPGYGAHCLHSSALLPSPDLLPRSAAFLKHPRLSLDLNRIGSSPVIRSFFPLDLLAVSFFSGGAYAYSFHPVLPSPPIPSSVPDPCFPPNCPTHNASLARAPPCLMPPLLACPLVLTPLLFFPQPAIFTLQLPL